MGAGHYSQSAALDGKITCSGSAQVGLLARGGGVTCRWACVGRQAAPLVNGVLQALHCLVVVVVALLPAHSTCRNIAPQSVVDSSRVVIPMWEVHVT